jgi:UDP-N-acetylglucosamine--N-acetylmuramyl-(pentapeptide) pyrophosphoryl-undecaprenol N-acetylglucosamine transferase
MNEGPAQTLRVAIACGGTGGHLFPGLAVAEELRQRGCAVTLLISPKDVDQQAVRGATGVTVATLPAVGLSRGGGLAFARGFARSYFASRKLFRADPPDAVLAMGGFTSAPPVLAGRAIGARTFLHESNTIPGRANRWLSRVTGQAFVGFPDAAARLRARRVKVTGTPVRAQFQPGNAEERRKSLGLDPVQPVLMVTGGSQGASGLNDLVSRTLPLLAERMTGLQLFHLTGQADVEKAVKAAADAGIKAVVRPFFAEMHVALGAATVVIARAGASSLAELAAMRVPAILVPFPAATDNHQYFNALAFEKTGAARLMQQKDGRPGTLAAMVVELAEQPETRTRMQEALARWHSPRAAEEIAESISEAIRERRRATGSAAGGKTPPMEHRQSLIT